MNQERGSSEHLCTSQICLQLWLTRYCWSAPDNISTHVVMTCSPMLYCIPHTCILPYCYTYILAYVLHACICMTTICMYYVHVIHVHLYYLFLVLLVKQKWGRHLPLKKSQKKPCSLLRKNKLDQCTLTHISNRPGKMVTHCVGLAVAGFLDLFLDGTHSTCGALSS